MTETGSDGVKYVISNILDDMSVTLKGVSGAVRSRPSINDHPRIEISKTFTFAAAHKLPCHKGKCFNLHGHEWKLRVFLTGIPNGEGMVMDYSDLKKIVNECIIDRLDHSMVNDTISNPTAETILFWIWLQLLNAGLYELLSKLELWEATDSCAVLSAENLYVGRFKQYS